MKKTIILGATTNPDRYAFEAARRFNEEGIDFILVGIKKGKVFDQEIVNDKNVFKEVDTITLYIGPGRHEEWEDYILKTKPKRLIFNPGTENTSLAQKVKKAGIEPIFACTLVMLSVGNY
jgi:hypothetical protein